MLKKVCESIKMVLFFGLLFLIATSVPLQAKEQNFGIVIVDKTPWQVSWIQEDDSSWFKKEEIWVLIARFDEAEIRTYFKQAPPEKGLGLSHVNKPIRQEFKDHFGRTLTSTTCEYEQFSDGTKCYGFLYEQLVKRKNGNFALSTAIVEEVGSANDEIRYSLFVR